MTVTTTRRRSPAAAPDEQTLHHAKAQTLKALALTGTHPAQERLAWFYDVDGDYAGATFLDLAPNDPGRFTAADIAAVRLLSVTVKAGAVRRLLEPGRHRDAINKALAAIPEAHEKQGRLADAGAATLDAMLDLYLQVKAVLSGPHVATPQSWVVASKLCARKRPSLFPVRDRAVCGYLDTLRLSRVRTDWLVFQHLIRDPEVTTGIEKMVKAVPAAAQDRTVRLDTERLRLLDAALWTAAQVGL